MGRLIPEDAPQEVVDGLAALVSNPLTADPNLGLMKVAQRIEELTQLVGRIAHADLTTIPASNISTNNLTATASYLKQTEQRMNDSIIALQANMQHAEQQIIYLNQHYKDNNNQHFNPQHKPAAESKAIQSIKPLTSDKKEFRLWNSKFINAIAQLHPDIRPFFEELTTYMDANRVPVTDQGVGRLVAATLHKPHPINLNKLNEDLFYILMDKCEGEAASRVLSVKKGEGLEAYQQIYLWFAGQSGMALSKRMEWVMRPSVPRDDYELAEAFEKWMTQVTLLENIGDDYKLAIPFKVTALRTLMSNKIDKFDQIKEQAKNDIPTTTPSEDIPRVQFSIMVTKLREYLTDKRLESNFSKNKDDMDIGGVGGKSEDSQNEEYQEEYGGYDYSNHDYDHNHNHDYSNHDYSNINAFGKGYKGYGKGGPYSKGKGKGKGKDITCYNCGEAGHIAAQCPYSKGGGKAKGGKGGKSPQCYNCGQFGHIAAYCPYPKGKGKGQQGKGWKGKGIQEFGYEANHYTQHTPHQPTLADYWPQQGGGFNLGGGSNPSIGGIQQHPVIYNVASSIPIPSPKPEVWTEVTRRKPKKTNAKQVRFADDASARGGNIHSISHDKVNSISGVGQYQGEWEVIKVSLDSGAVDTVTPPSTAKYFPIQETDSSRNGIHYRAANGTKIHNHGARIVRGISKDFKEMNLVMNVADVQKTLASAFQIVNAGNKIILDTDYSYIVNKATGEKTEVTVDNGEFLFDLWVPAPKDNRPPMKIDAFGRFTPLIADEEPSQTPEALSSEASGFTRQDVF